MIHLTRKPSTAPEESDKQQAKNDLPVTYMYTTPNSSLRESGSLSQALQKSYERFAMIEETPSAGSSKA